MKRYIALLLCLVMTISMFSCDVTEKNKGAESSTAPIEEQPEKDVTEGEETTDSTESTKITEAERAMQMYEAAIKGEICVVDKEQGEIKLKDCCFPSNDLPLGRCDILNKAILDMDGDGINEYVIQSPQRDHIILHYFDGKIYSYSFDFKNLFRLNTDGTFYWYFTESNLPTVGLSQVTFDDSSIVIKEIYRLKDIWERAEEYYLYGNQVTWEEYTDYYYNNSKRWAQFTPFEFSPQYPINAETAWNIANDYLGKPDGEYDVATGTRIVYKVVLTQKPTVDSENYRIVLHEYHFCHWLDGWQANEPKPTYVLEELVVNAITGACREYKEPIPDGKE